MTFAHEPSPNSLSARHVPAGKARLYELLSSFKTGTLVIREGKYLATRPVTVLRVDDGEAVWLAMPKDHCADSIGAQPEVQLVCQSPNVHLTVSGVARLMNPTASSELLLINLDPATGEYWDQMHYSHATLWRRS